MLPTSQSHFLVVFGMPAWYIVSALIFPDPGWINVYGFGEIVKVGCCGYSSSAMTHWIHILDLGAVPS